ncbi:MAG: hypothetical protein COV59_04205 [Candidatus Magasanikbacteria bacterium CG11_big_fil_rev_8_21_14_0_20_39_34]|uniref:Uncharacterized protein n=1 Tax=Candidatus Magasanikbacteria bacterium CG11_big_fil_rev_8_21_14_0_20_39_34 TaxID=1974653 RepID=A0A2H0N4M0_9BACT|nr:MAG: hypothetical protein COV59_04205 [Candidatus Magasanikbacteria bacterium CG11_big_fil_rev_8_21_14_0_20_39_34]
MSLSENEKNKIVALQVAKTRAIQKNRVLDTVREKQIKKELIYYKQKLSESCNQNDSSKSFEILEKLIQLQGELLELILHKIQNRYGYVSDAITQKLTKIFIRDSHELSKNVLTHFYG